MWARFIGCRFVGLWGSRGVAVGCIIGVKKFCFGFGMGCGWVNGVEVLLYGTVIGWWPPG